MENILNILKQDLSSLGPEGSFILYDALERGVDPLYAARQMPVEDRLRVYNAVLDHQHNLLRQISPEAFNSFVSALGVTIDFRDPTTLPAAMQVLLDRPTLRVANSDQKLPFNSTESIRLNHLAYILMWGLPNPAKVTSRAFIKTQLDDDEKGMVLGFLSSAQDSYVLQVLINVKQEAKLTPQLWQGFKKVCLSSGSEKQFSTDITILTDRLVKREIMRRPPSAIAALGEEQAFNFLYSLTSAGSKTRDFEEARAYLFQHLGVPQSHTEKREQQIDTFIQGVATFSDKGLDALIEQKQQWSSLSIQEITDTLEPYHQAIADIFEMPQIASLQVTSWENAPPNKPKIKPNGYYSSWEVRYSKWGNTVYLIHDSDNEGRPLSVRRSLRSAFSTLTHEDIHCSDEQLGLLTLPIVEARDNYLKAIPASARPDTLTHDKKGFYTSHFINLNASGLNDRKRYISPEPDFAAYRNQPYEKFAWSFQNQFVAAMNGAIVTRQVDSGRRILHNDLTDFFKKAEQVLTARKILTGRDGDFRQLKNYGDADHPFGALTNRDSEYGEKATENTSTQIRTDYSSFDNKLGALTYFQRVFDRLNQESSTDKDFIPFFYQTADFLVQLSDELWAVGHSLKNRNAALADKIKDLSFASESLGEDTHDYAFYHRRLAEIKGRPEKQQKIISDLIAAL